jgi:hypothetical protein
MARHLSLAVHPVADRDALSALRLLVLPMLDPPSSLAASSSAALGTGA